MNTDPAVSVIIPVYGVEKYVRRCVETLMNQTLESVEFIFVDDCSKDRSMDIVREVVDRFPHREVFFLRHNQNRGLPAARNTGMAIARGEYIYHCDSDDFLELTMLEKLWNAAREHDSDVVWCDWFLSFNANERYMSQIGAATGREALTLALNGSIKYNVWNKLIRRSLYTENGISFPDGFAMGEDMTIIKLLACASKVFYVPDALYHYIKVNNGAMTQSYSSHHLESLKHNVADTEHFLMDNVSDEALEKELAFFKLNTKLPFLITNNRQSYVRWNEWFSDANKWIWKNSSQPFRTKLIQWSASKKLYFINKLYYSVVIKFIYGVLFR